MGFNRGASFAIIVHQIGGTDHTRIICQVKDEIDSYSRLPHRHHRSCWWSLCQHQVHHQSTTSIRRCGRCFAENLIRVDSEFSTRPITSIGQLNFTGTKYNPCSTNSQLESIVIFVDPTTLSDRY